MHIVSLKYDVISYSSFDTQFFWNCQGHSVGLLFDISEDFSLHFLLKN